MDVQGIIEDAYRNSGAAMAEPIALQAFRDAYAASTKIVVTLSPSDQLLLKRMAPFPTIYKPAMVVHHDHVFLAAIRELIRGVHEKSVKGGLSHISVPTLVIGASAREVSKYDSNPNISFHFHAQESKDWTRIVEPVLAEIVSSVSKKIQNAVDAEPRRVRLGSLEQTINNLSENATQARYGTQYRPAVALISEDSLYNFNEKTICELFEQTGASVLYGYMLLPHELMFSDYPPSTIYTFEKHYRNGVEYNGITFPGGFSTGYIHRRSDWISLFNAKGYFSNGTIYLRREITSRVGPMVTFKIYHAQPGSMEIERWSVPEADRWVRVLDFWASVNHTNMVLKSELKYIPVNESEFYDIINYLHSLDEKSRTMANAVMLIKRRMNGISLLKQQWIPPWKLRAQDVAPIAFTAVLYVNQMERDMTKAIKKIDFDSATTKIARGMYNFFNSVFWPIREILDFIFARDLQDKLVLFPVHDCTHLSVVTIPKYTKRWIPIDLMVTPTKKKGSLPTYVPPDPKNTLLEKMIKFDWRGPYVADTQNDEIITCWICDLWNNIAPSTNTQKLRCAHVDKTITVAQSAEDLRHASSDVLELEDGTEAGLLGVIKRYKEGIKTLTPFSYAIQFLFIVGAPGTGKSYTTRWLHYAFTKTMQMNCAVICSLNSAMPDYQPRTMRDDDKDLHDFKFKTNHRVLDLSNLDVLIVEEWTLMPWEFVISCINKTRPKFVILVGDDKQNKVLIEHGTYIGNVINVNTISRHFLTKNYRNPANIVWMMVRDFQYQVEATKPFSHVDVIDVSDAKQYIDQGYQRLFFSWQSIAKYSGFSEAQIAKEKLKLTVFSNQGKTFKNVLLYCMADDVARMAEDSQLIVALTRHTDRLILVINKANPGPCVLQMFARIRINVDGTGELNDPNAEFLPTDIRASDDFCNHLDDPQETTQCYHSFMPEDIPRMPARTYVEGCSLPESHYGQRKLALMECNFLGEYARENDTVLYVGAAPCDHFPFIYSAFKHLHLKWILVDPRPFNQCVALPDVVVVPTYFTPEMCAKFKGTVTLFISDLRTSSAEAPLDTDILTDNRLQYDIMKGLEPRVSMLKFRLPYNDEAFRYAYGECWFQPWIGSAELRLIVTDHKKQHEYNGKQLEEVCAYYNHVLEHCKVNTPYGLACYQCAYELKILQNAGFRSNPKAASKMLTELLENEDFDRPKHSRRHRPELNFNDNTIFEPSRIMSTYLFAEPAKPYVPNYKQSMDHVTSYHMRRIKHLMESVIAESILQEKLAVEKQLTQQYNSDVTAAKTQYLESSQVANLTTRKQMLYRAATELLNLPEPFKVSLNQLYEEVYDYAFENKLDAWFTSIKLDPSFVAWSQEGKRSRESHTTARIMNHLGFNPETNAVLLDYGGGDGGIADYLGHKLPNATVLYTDILPGLDRKRAKFIKPGEYVRTAYDVVICLNSLHHIRTKIFRSALDSITLSIKRGGLLYVYDHFDLDNEQKALVNTLHLLQDVLYNADIGVPEQYFIRDQFVQMMSDRGFHLEHIIPRANDIQGRQTLIFRKDQLHNPIQLQIASSIGVDVMLQRPHVVDPTVLSEDNSDRDYVRSHGDSYMKLINNTGADFTEHVTEIPLFVGPRVSTVTGEIPDNTRLEFKPVKSPMDAFRLIETLVPEATFDESFRDDVGHALNATGAQVINDYSRDMTVDVDALILDTNVRGHPVSPYALAYTQSTGLGLQMVGNNPMTSIKTMRERYNATEALPKVTAQLMKWTREQHKQYKEMYKKKQTFADFLENEQLFSTLSAKCADDVLFRHYWQQYNGLGETDIKTQRFNIKQTFKPIVLHKAIDEMKSGQGTVSSNIRITTFWMLFWRAVVLFDAMTDTDCGDHMAFTDHTRTDAEYKDRVNVAIAAQYGATEPEAVFADAIKFDSTQGKAANFIEDHYYLFVLGIPRMFVEHYRALYSKQTLISKSAKGSTGVTTSGKATTLEGNGVIMKTAVFAATKSGGKSILLYKGDDAVRYAVTIDIDKDALLEIKRMIGLDLTIKKSRYGNFCGMLYTPAGLYPDIIRRIEKFAGARFRDYTHFCEYQQSLRDYMGELNAMGLETVIASTMTARRCTLDEVMSVYWCLDSWSHVGRSVFDERYKRVTAEFNVYGERNGVRTVV